MAIPVKYRQRLLDQAQGQMIVTMYQEPCLFIYPMPEWEIVEKRLSELSTLDDTAQAIRRLMLGHATEVDMDSHGRLLLPPLLRESAGVEKNLMLIGQGERFEVWDERTWSEQRQVWRDKASRLDKSQLSPELKALKF